MTESSLSFSFSYSLDWQIRRVIADLSPLTAASSSSLLRGLVDLFGDDARTGILRSLMDSPESAISLLLDSMPELRLGGSFASCVARALMAGQVSERHWRFLEALGLGLVERIRVSLALSQSLESDIREKGIEMMKALLPEVLRSENDTVPLNDFHELVHFIKGSDAFSVKQKQVLSQSLEAVFPSSEQLVMLAPLVSVGELTNAVGDSDLGGTEALMAKLDAEIDVSLVFVELGYISTASVLEVSRILRTFSKLDEQDFGRLLASMAQYTSGVEASKTSFSLLDTSIFSVAHAEWDGFPEKVVMSQSSEMPVGWNTSTLVQAIQEYQSNLDWNLIYRSLDCDVLKNIDKNGFAFLIDVYRCATEKQRFPVELLCEPWRNLDAQFSLIKEALTSSIDVVDFNDCSSLCVLPAGIHLPPPSLVEHEPSVSTFGISNNAWLSLDLVKTLLQLSNSYLFNEVHQLFTPAVEYLPEAILCSLSQIKLDCLLKDQIQGTLLPKYIVNHPNSSVLLSSLWNIDSEVIVQWMVKLYQKDHGFLSRILDVAQDLKVVEALSVILRACPYFFAIDLATLASRREFLNLGKWLASRISEIGKDFLLACMEYIKDYSDFINSRAVAKRHCVPLMTVDTLKEFFDVFSSNSHLLSKANVDELSQLFLSCKPAPKQRNEDIEKEANTYFQKIYDSSISVNEMVNILRVFKSSKDFREKEVYLCMIHSLFDEYRFFRKYPEMELQITGVLFGTLINNLLLEDDHLALALKYVLESLESPPDQKLYRFGVWAVENFVDRIPEFKEFSVQLSKISHFWSQHSDLVNSIRRVLSSKVDEVTSSKLVETTPTSSSIPKFTKIDPEVLVQAYGEKAWDKVESEIREKLSFIVNSLVATNIGEKSQEICTLLEPKYYDHFAQYLVAKRVSVESNNLELYLATLKKMNSPGFLKAILRATYFDINLLLSTELVLSPGPERNLLKCLGLWLGELTVARNKPPLAKYLNLKRLILEGYLRNRLSAAVPLVCKILISCAKSKVFKPPNPWLMSLLSLLAETYQLADLKLNIKFEIEVVFQKLQLELEEVPVRDYFPRLVLQKRGTIANAAISSTSIPDGEVARRGVENVPVVSQPPAPIPLQPLPRSVVISPTVASFFRGIPVKELIELSLDTSVREIIAPVVERSAHIACITTRELIIKDFAMESNEAKMRRAAHQMVHNLTGNLAIFTGKEPLRVSFYNNLKTLFVQKMGQALDANAEELLRQVVVDNIEFGCLIIERSAWERATSKIDEQLQPFYMIRKTHREQTGTPFFDTSIFSSGSQYPAALPEQLRPKPGLTSQQMRVYEDFFRTDAKRPMEPGILPVKDEVIVGKSTTGGQSVLLRDPHTNDLIQAQESLDVVLSKLDQLIVEASKTDPSLVLAGNEIHSTIQKVSTILFQLNTAHRQELAVAFTSKVFAMLMDSNIQTQLDLCLLLLKAVRVAYTDVSQDLTALLVRALEEQIFNIDSVLGLVREGLVRISPLDSMLAKIISTGHVGMIDMILAFLGRAVIVEKIVPLDQFRNTIDVLIIVAPRASGQLGERLALFLENLKPLISRPDAILATAGPQDALIKERLFPRQCFYLFDEWLSLFLRQPSLPEKLLVHVIGLFEREGILKSQSALDDFFKIVLPACIDSSSTHKNGTDEMRPEFIDSLSKLVVVLVKIMQPQSASSGAPTSVSVMVNFLGTLCEVAIADFQRGASLFNQKPYFRLLSNLLQDFGAKDSLFDSMQEELFITLCRVFHNINPLLIPVFAFNWLELISHRSFLPAILSSKKSRCISAFQLLLLDLFKFLEKYLRKAELTSAVSHLYRGTLRVLLVLLHDFPEFLCEYHLSFCDAIPSSCIQMRNLILSAFPRNMRLPDPFLPNLKVDLLPEIKQDPVIRSDPFAALSFSGLNKLIDSYMKKSNGSVDVFYEDLVSKLYLPSEMAISTGCIYNVPLINSLVLYVGIQGIKSLRQDASGGNSDDSTSAMEIFQGLATVLDEEGRYFFLNAVANQLRYPNNHTHYFSCILLFLFAEAQSEIVREQITKVLLERLIVHRPHPWGLLITFIELIKNPRYNLLDHEFTKCAPEIESLFESVARSCMQNAASPAEPGPASN